MRVTARGRGWRNGDLADPDAVEALRTARDDTDADVRAYARRALEVIA